MKRSGLKLLIAFIAIIGQMISLSVFIWQSLTNMYGLWFWFSFQSCMGWGFLIALMRDISFVNEQRDAP